MSWPQYSEYRATGIEWIGDVPSHWRVAKIKHIAKFAGGGTPSRTEPSFWGGDIPWVSPKDMKLERISAAEEQITQVGLEGSTAVLVPLGRVLMVVRSGILKHTIPIAINEVAVALNQDMKALRFREDRCLPTFFKRYVQGLNAPLLQLWSKPGATVESIEHEYLSESEIVLPPIDEQVRITQFLDRETAQVDALIDKQERLIQLLQEKRQALITRAVTKGFDPIVPMKGSGVDWLGDVPVHWEVTRIKHLVRSIEQGWSPECENRRADEGEWGVLKVGCVNGGIFNPAENKALPSSLKPKPDLALKAGDVLVSRANTRDLVGSCSVVPANYPRLMLCDKLYRLRAGHLAIPEYLAILVSVVGRREVELAATGASVSMVNVSQATITGLTVPLPPLAEQQMILDTLEKESSTINAASGRLKRAVELSREHRSALISAAVTGKIDVREAA